MAKDTRAPSTTNGTDDNDNNNNTDHGNGNGTDDNTNDKDNDKDTDDDSSSVRSDFAPTTVVILLGSMNFEPDNNSTDVLSFQIDTIEERDDLIQDAVAKLAPNTIQQIHLLLKSSSISSLFDVSIFTAFVPTLITSGHGAVTIHVLPESAILAEDMPVQPGDVEAIRMALVVTGFALQAEEQNIQGGSWTLSAVRPRVSAINDDDDDDDDNEEHTSSNIATHDTEEENEFRKLVNAELEKDDQ